MPRGILTTSQRLDCTVCGSTFTAKTRSQKYCTPGCKNLGGAALRRARNSAASERRCYGCKLTKPSTEFTSPTHPYCRPCWNSYNGEWAKNNHPKRAEYKRRAVAKAAAADPLYYRKLTLGKFGLTPDAFDSLLEGQGGRCAICRTDAPGGRHGTWHVDHDHACCPKGRSCGTCVRGLLCNGCNLGLGYFRDDPDLLGAALAYVANARTT